MSLSDERKSDILLLSVLKTHAAGIPLHQPMSLAHLLGMLRSGRNVGSEVVLHVLRGDEYAEKSIATRVRNGLRRLVENKERLEYDEVPDKGFAKMLAFVTTKFPKALPVYNEWVAAEEVQAGSYLKDEFNMGTISTIDGHEMIKALKGELARGIATGEYKDQTRENNLLMLSVLRCYNGKELRPEPLGMARTVSLFSNGRNVGVQTLAQIVLEVGQDGNRANEAIRNKIGVDQPEMETVMNDNPKMLAYVKKEFPKAAELYATWVKQPKGANMREELTEENIRALGGAQQKFFTQILHENIQPTSLAGKPMASSTTKVLARKPAAALPELHVALAGDDARTPA